MSNTTFIVTVLIPLCIAVPLIAFWFWMFRDMLQNDYIAGNVRVIWLIGFIFASVLTAGYYYFTEYRIRH